MVPDLRRYLIRLQDHKRYSTGGALLHVAADHHDGVLDVHDSEIVILARDILGAQDAHLLAGGDGAREYAAKPGVEYVLVGGR